MMTVRRSRFRAVTKEIEQGRSLVFEDDVPKQV